MSVDFFTRLHQHQELVAKLQQSSSFLKAMKFTGNLIFIALLFFTCYFRGKKLDLMDL